MSGREAPAALRWTIYVAVAVVFAIACAFLSDWQFTRNEARAGELALVAENYDASPVALESVLPEGDVLAPDDEWTPVRVTGTYLADRQLLVRNRPHGGSAAYEVLVPLRLADGRVLIIDRGWVTPGERQALPDVVPAPPVGEVTVVARLRPEEAVPTSGRSAEAGQVPTINLGLVAEQAGPIERGAYGLLVSEDPAPATAPRAVEPPSDDPGPHLSYAVQWILFAAMGFAFIGYVIVSERRIRREDLAEAAEALARGETPPTPSVLTAHRRRRRARDRDAEDEDALLDVR